MVYGVSGAFTCCYQCGNIFVLHNLLFLYPQVDQVEMELQACGVPLDSPAQKALLAGPDGMEFRVGPAP